MYVYLCTTHVPGALCGHKRALDLLDLDLQRAMSCDVGAGIKTRLSVITVCILNLLNHVFSPI